MAIKYFVAPSGNDSAKGSIEAPFRTLKKAVSILCAGDTLVLRGGVYRETLTLSTVGTANQPIIIEAYKGEVPVISALDKVESGWQKDLEFKSYEKDESFVYYTDVTLPMGNGNQVFENNEPLFEARWPHSGKANPLDAIFATIKKTDGKSITDEMLPCIGNLEGCTLWCIGGAAWIAWNCKVSGFDEKNKTLYFDRNENDKIYGHFYDPRQGNKYMLTGKKELLGKGEWWYDENEKRLYVCCSDNSMPGEKSFEYKVRNLTADFSGASHVIFRGVTCIGGGILTNNMTSYITLDNIKVFHTNNDYLGGARIDPSYGSVSLLGDHINLENSELAYSTNSIVNVRGCYNRVFNCFLHHGGYAAVWSGAFSVAGFRNHICHNTVCYSGRDLVSIHGICEGVIEYNDLHHSGCITSDLGLTYGHNTDGNGTILRYNYVHDNLADDCSFGIYFDHLSHNFIVHDNYIERVKNDPIRFNNPSYCDLVFSNQSSDTGATSTFDHANRQDLFEMRYFDNVCNKEIKYPDHVYLNNNKVVEKILPLKIPFSVGKASEAKVYEGILLETEHPVWDKKEYPLASKIYNGCFEQEKLNGWQVIGLGKAELVKGNNWGHIPYANTGTSKQELMLKGKVIVCQTVETLAPSSEYIVSGWLRSGTASQKVYFGILFDDPDESAIFDALENASVIMPDFHSVGIELVLQKPQNVFLAGMREVWQRYSIRFNSGERTSVNVVFACTGGEAFCDNAFLLKAF